jgi:chromate transporter
MQKTSKRVKPASQRKIPPKESLSRSQLFWILFRTTFTLSAFTFGGGYVIVPLMRKMFVEKYRWIDEQEMLDLIAISQSAPGIIAVNASILIGYKVAGVGGALITLLGTVTPPLITLTLLSYIYGAIKDLELVKLLLYGMSIGVSAVILDAVISMGAAIFGKRQLFPVVLMFAAFAVTLLLNVHIIIILAVCALLGIGSTWIGGRKAGMAGKADQVSKDKVSGSSSIDRNSGGGV